jgi:hypothetical protein
VPGYVSLALTILVCGSLAHAPQKQAGQAARQSRAATNAARDVLRAFIEHVEWAPDDRIAAHPRLDPKLLEDLRAVLGDRLSPLLSTPGYLVAANVVTIDDVDVKGDDATVVVTYGPVPAKPLVECGTQITFVLHRANGWLVNDDNAWARCASRGKRAATDAEEELREVFRLAMSELRFGLNKKFVAGRSLSPLARRVLAAATTIYSDADVATSELRLTADAVVLSKLTIDGRVASIEGTSGPMAARGTLDCGQGFVIRFRRAGQGWVLERNSQIVC